MKSGFFAPNQCKDGALILPDCSQSVARDLAKAAHGIKTQDHEALLGSLWNVAGRRRHTTFLLWTLISLVNSSKSLQNASNNLNSSKWWKRLMPETCLSNSSQYFYLTWPRSTTPSQLGKPHSRCISCRT